MQFRLRASVVVIFLSVFGSGCATIHEFLEEVTEIRPVESLEPTTVETRAAAPTPPERAASSERSAETSEQERKDRAARHLASEGNTYRCKTDPFLAGAIPLSDENLNRVNHRISQTQPEWRLAKESEIGCWMDGRTASRFGDVLHPATYNDYWGSGKAWWIRTGDFNGDGKKDLVAIVTLKGDQTSGALLAMFDTGESHLLEFGFDEIVLVTPNLIIPRGTVIETCMEGDVEFANDGISAGSAMYRWSGRDFQSAHRGC